MNFSSKMKFFVFFILAPFVNSELHILITTYTGITGLKNPGTPEFSAVTTLDDQQIDYYDSNDETLIPRQEWMKKYTSTDQWKKDVKIRKHVQQIYRDNSAFLMERFGQTDGVHVYQRMYGCEWDDLKKTPQGFDQYGYDGEDFIWLDLEENRYISPMKEGTITVEKWNNNRDELNYLQQYYNNECIYWMNELLKLREAVESKAPEVFLLQRTPSSPVVCRATGLHNSGVHLTLFKNGEKNNDVDIGELLPNGDGTFQKNITLYIYPDDWKMNQYVCVLEHMGKTIQKILTDDEIRSKKSAATSSLYYALFLLICFPVGGVFLWHVYRKLKPRLWKKTKHLRSTSEAQSLKSEQTALNSSAP